MNSKRLLAAATVLALFVTSSALAATREEKRVADAADVIDQLSRIPEKAIPPSLLSRAYAVAVVPNVVRAAFGLVGVDEVRGPDLGALDHFSV